MYLQHFGLRGKPFTLAFDPACYYPVAHQDASNDLLYSIEERQGLATLVGEPGTGKTTLLNNLMKAFDSNIRGIFISDGSLGGGSLIKRLLGEFGLPAPDSQTAAIILKSYLQNWLLMGKKVVLLVDEAQALAPAQLEEVRSLTNLEFEGKKLVEIVLSGQPSLERTLSSHEFEALRQRIAVRTYVQPLSLDHSVAYIQLRLEAAGARDFQVFGPTALQMVHQRSRGIPRLINLICDRSLLMGFADGLYIIDAQTVEKAASELGIDRVTSSAQDVANRPQMRLAPPTASDSVQTQLAAIEGKLDVILDAMAISGLLSVGDHPREALDNERPQPATSGAPDGRFAELPKYRRRNNS